MNKKHNREKKNLKSAASADGLCNQSLNHPLPVTQSVNPLTNPSVNPLTNPSITNPTPATSVPTLEQIRNELNQSYCVTDTGHIFASDEERTLYINKQKLFHDQEVVDYYSKYKNELCLSFTKSKITKADARKELHKFLNKLYAKLYGRYRAKYVNQDIYAVLEFKDKNKQTTRPHWHLLLALPDKEKNNELTSELISKMWKHGESWVREEAMTDPHLYVMDYLTKNADSYHYLGEQ